VFHAPRRALDQAIEVFAVGMVHALFDPTLPALRTLSAQLDAVPTADPALRSGRTAWRKTVGAIAALPPLDDPCGKLIAWRRSGYAPSAAPALDRAKLKALNDSGGPDPRFARAARRMRALGVSKSAADRFTGDPLFRGVLPTDDIFNTKPIRHGETTTLR
jgi:hypothetical protein